jgi:N4-gp56 family major capsid protein
MTQSTYAVNDPLAVKALPKFSWWMKSGFVGKDPNANCVLVLPDLQGKYGDQITHGIIQQIRGYSAPGDTNARELIKRVDALDDKVALNQQRCPVSGGGRMSNKRVPFEIADKAKDLSADYWGVRLDEEFTAKASGALGVGQWETLNPNASGFDVVGAVDSDGNTLRTPSTNRIVYAGSAGTKVGLTSGDKFSLDLVDKGLLKAYRLQANSTTRRKMAPLRIGGKNVWVCVMDLVQAADLKASAGGRWYDIEKARLQGGFKDSALIQQSLGVYESFAGSVAFFSHEGMVKFNDYGAGGDVEAARALLMGQGAMVFAPGEKMGLAEGLYSTWHEETDNLGNEVIITTGLIYGVQKNAYRTARGAADNSREDYGIMALDSAAAWSAA